MTQYIAGTVNARRDVHVNALATRDIETVIVSVGAGIGGVAGSVGVYTLGGNLNSTYSSEGSSSNAVNDPDGNSSTSYADNQAAGTKNSSMLSAFSDPNNDPGSHNTGQVRSTTADIDAKVKAAVPSSVVASQLSADVINAQRTLPRGTSAFIAKNAVVNAGRHLDIDAREHIALTSKVGGIGAGAVGVGIGVGIVSADTPVTAYIDDGADIRAGTVDATGAVNLNAQLHAVYDLVSYVGTGGGAAIGAAVAVVTDDSDVKAYVANSSLTRIRQGAALNIKAESDLVIDALTPNVSVGGVSAGASIATITLSGDTIAFIGDNTRIGQSSGGTMGDVRVIADAKADAEVDAWVVSAGMANGFAANVGTVDITSKVQAFIGDNVNITAAGDVTVKALSQTTADAGVWGVTVSAGLSMGGSFATVDVDLDVDAYIGHNSSVTTSGGSVTLEAAHNKNSGFAKADAMASGGGLYAGNGAVADATLNVSVDASVGEYTQVTASDDIVLLAVSKSAADAASDSVTVGGVAIAPLYAKTTINSNTRVSLRLGAKLDAGRDITLKAVAEHQGKADSDSSGGGVIGALFADTKVTMGYETSVSAGMDAALNAGGTLLALSQTKVQGEAVADAIGGGAGAGSDASATLLISTPKAVTETTTGSNVVLKGNKIRLIAETPLIKGKAYSDAQTYGAVGGSNSDAVMKVNEKTQVNVGENNEITGTELVEIWAQHLALDTDAQSDSTTIAAGGGTADAENNLQTLAWVNLPASVTVITRDLSIAARSTVEQYRKVADMTGIGPENTSGKLIPKRQVDLNADVIIFSNPHIIWRADGSIYRNKYAQGVSFNTLNHEAGFEVGDIKLDETTRGNIRIDVNEIKHKDLDAQGTGEIKGTGTNLQFAFEYVKIEQQYDGVYGGKTLPLTVNDIDAIYRGTQPGIEFESTAIAYTDDDWIILNGHGFKNGQVFTYATRDAALYGLENGGQYYVVNVQPDKFQISTEAGGAVVDLKLSPGANALQPGHYFLWDADQTAFSYTFDPTTYEDTSVELIKHTETTRTEESPIRLQGEISNPYGSTIIRNGLGDILQVADSTVSRVHTHSLTLEAKKGKIGDARKLNLELVQYTDSQGATAAPKLSAEARDNIHLALGARRYDPNSSDITVAVEKMTAGTDIDLLLNGSSHITRNASGSSWTWTSSAGPASVYDFTMLENGGAKDIVINSAVLTTSGDANTWISVLGKMKLASGGKLYARTTGNISLREMAGSIWVGDVKSTRGKVELYAVDDVKVDGGFFAALLSTIYVDYQDTDTESGTVWLNNLDAINASIVIYGDGSHDFVYVNDAWDADDEDGSLANTWLDGVNVTLTKLTGLGMTVTSGVSIDRFAGKIENLDIKLGGGKNTLTVRGTTATTTIDMGGGQDILDVGPGAVEGAAGITGDLTDTKINGMGGQITYNDNAETLLVTLGAGQDDFTVKTTSGNVHTTVNSGGGNDVLTVQDSGLGGILNVYGGAGMDYIIFQNHHGTTTLNGDNSQDNINDVAPPTCDAATKPCPGDDRFFIQKADGNLTVYGGVGADKYFVASNASLTSFTTNGVYDDTLSTFGDLSGDLSGITGQLTIFGNTAGNGGYKDRLYVYAGATTSNGILDGDTLTGLSMAASGSIRVDAVEEGHIKLGAGNDVFTVRNVPSGVTATVYGGDGADLLEVGSTANLLADIDGTLFFHGEGGADTLKAHNEGDTADCAADPNTDWACGQMTAVGLSGLDMGGNSLATAHIFYGTQATDGSIASTTEYAQVYLGSGADKFFVDSAAPDTQLYVYSGAGDDTIRVEATPFGLNPASLRRVDFIAGTANIYGGDGEDLVIINDSGDDKANTGQFENGSVSGLGITGSVYFGDTSEKLEIDLGEQNDTFSVRTTPAYLATTLKMAGGFDTVYVGNTGNSLDGIQGKLRIEGELPYANDMLIFSDQGDTDDNTYTIHTAVTGTIQVPDPNNPAQLIDLPVNETTLQRSGSADIVYLTVEKVSLNAGLGADTIYLKSTHLELDPLGGHNSVFGINAGGGDDSIYLSDNSSLDAIDIRVMIEGGAGSDFVQFDNSSSQQANTLTFLAKRFDELFASQTATWLADFQTLLNDNSLSTSTTFGSVSMGLVADPNQSVMDMDVNVRDAELRVLLGDSDDVFRLSGGPFEMPLRVDAAGGNDTFNISDDVTTLDTVTLNGDDGDDLVFVDFSSAAPNATISNIIFNGGTHGVAGDTLRIAGDGVASGTYTPSSTVARAGTVLVNGNTFTFTGVEPLVVHGLAGFAVVMPDALSDLAIETIDLADLNLTNLVLHSVTVDGVISWRQQVKLAGINSPEPKSYGQALALSKDGNTLVVGADRVGQMAGVVFVYARSGSNWVEQAKLYPDDRLSGGGWGFGRAVAVDGSLLVIGAPQDINRGYDTGAVYIYRLVNGAWTQEWKQRGESSGHKFGAAVDVDSSNGRIMVGAPGTGSVYLYTYDGSQLINKWPLTVKLNGSGEFGTAVDLDSSGVALIGAPSANGTGEAYLYYRAGSGSWTLHTTLTSISQQSGERFGAAVAIKQYSGRAVVGSPNYDGTNTDQGAAWVFEESGGNWSLVARLTADGGLPPDEATHEGNAGDHFGASVAIHGDYVAVGAPDYDGNSANQGKVYVFYRHERACGGACDPVAWTRSHNLASSTPAENEYFGKAVALGDKLLVAGVPGFNETDANNNIVRAGIGIIRTYVTDGSIAVNDFTNTATGLYRAEALSGGANFGRKTIYDPTYKELIVSAYGENKIYIYVNEGLFWRLTQTLTQSGNFGYDMDKDGNRLVIGAPGANKFYVYERGANGWELKSTVGGPTGASGFGASVSVNGNRVAVGAPDTVLWYSSSNQPQAGYQLNLGKTGVAFTYTTSGANWTLERFLMPYDSGLYFATYQEQSSGGTVLDNMLSYDDGDGDTLEYKDFLNVNSTAADVKLWLGLDASYVLPPGMVYARDLKPDSNATSYKVTTTTYSFPEAPPQICVEDNDSGGFFGKPYDGWKCWADYDGIGSLDLPSDFTNDDKNIKISPRAKGRVYDNDGADDGGTWTNDSWIDWYTRGGCDCADFLYAWANSSGRFQEASVVDMTYARTFNGLNNAAFGASIELNGSTVYVGASGINRQYSADVTGSPYTSWSTAFDSVGSPMRVGAAASNDGSVTYAGGSAEDIYFDGGGANWLPAYASLAYNGFYRIVGNPVNNTAQLFEGASLAATLTSDGNVNQFGHGVSFVNTGLFLVGTGSAGQLFNFRQRGPQWTYQSSTIPAPLPTAKFGASVDIDGYTAVVGAPQFDNRGAAFIFEQDPGAETWSLKAQLEGAGTGTGDDFGSAVAISQGRLVVGAPNANSGAGAAYFFDQVGTSWIENARLAPSDLSANAHFGTAADVYKDTAVVGAPGMNATYTFVRQSAQWQQQDKLTGSGAFGSSVAIDNDTLIVGAPNANGNAGSASVYTFSAGSWGFQAALTASGGASGDAFGTAVDLGLLTTGATAAVVGAPGDNSGAGSAYTFTRSGNTWTQQQELSVGTLGAGDSFGFDVAIDRDLLVVGAYKAAVSRTIGSTTITYPNEGAAFAFGLNNGLWQLQTVTKPLFGSDGYDQDYVGYSVAISGTLALAGAPQWDGRPGNALDTDGAGYVYITELSAPMTVVLPKAVSTIIAGEKSNRITGTAGGTAITELRFFDVKAFTLNTGAGNHADQVRLGSDGLQAFGLQQFTVSTGPGEDTFTIEASDLSLPTDGAYLPGNLSGYTEGQSLTEAQSNQLYTKVNTNFTYIGGVNNLTDKVVFATDADLTLTGNALVSPIKGKLNLNTVYHVVLTAGPGDNIIRARGWAGKVSMDGMGGDDRYELDLSTLNNAVVTDSSANAGERDELTILGTTSNDVFLAEGTRISVGGKTIDVASSGAELIRIAARAGDDTITVNPVEMSDIALDGMEGSDTYILNLCGGSAAVTVKDSSVWGDDTLIINGTSGDDAFTVGETVATCGNSVTIRYDNSPETFIVDAKDGQDNITIDGNPWNVYGSSAVYGGAGDDVIQINDVNKYGLAVDGQSGSDSYRIAVPLSGPLSASDSSGTDYILIDGTGGDDTVLVTSTEIQVNGATLYTFSSFSNGGLQVSGIEGVNLDLKAGNDQIAFNSLPTDVALAVSGGTGKDAFSLVSLSALYLSGAQYDLRIYGNADDDTLAVDASVNGTGAVLQDRLTGFGLLRPVYYYDPEGFAASLVLSSGGDTLTRGATLGSWAVAAGAGDDTLVASNAGNTWQITQSDAGYIGDPTEFVFSGFENLTGGPGDDEFIFASGVSLVGKLDGRTGKDTLNLSSALGAQTVVLTGDGSLDGFAGTNAHAGGGFDNIDALVATSNNDVLVGANLTNTWVVTAANAGTINGKFSFTSVERLVGGSAGDTLDYSGYGSARGVAISGAGGVDGYAGTDSSLNVGFDNMNALVGSAFADALTGPDVVNVWKVTAANAGTLN
ncbi:MAG: hypothetical protein GXP40_02795, partial [Chloroflexi bacterium]|nr:hypothetical protein [Chloroflexota bacterium]